MRNNKNKYFLLTLFIMFSISSLAQDYIILKTGEEIEAKILDFHATDVSYRIFNDLSGEIKYIPKTQILLIKYNDGTNLVLTNEKFDSTKVKTFINTNIKEIAIRDAQANYNPIGSAISSGCLTVGCLPVGLLLSLKATSQTPQTQNLNIPEAYKDNAEYCEYYTLEAINIKRRNIIIGTTIGLAVDLAILTFILIGF